MNPQIVLNIYLGAEAAKSAEQIAAAVASSLPAPTDYFAGQAESLPTPMDDVSEASMLPTPLDAMAGASAATGDGLPTPFDFPGSGAALPQPTGAGHPVTAPPPKPEDVGSSGSKK